MDNLKEIEAVLKSLVETFIKEEDKVQKESTEEIYLSYSMSLVLVSLSIALKIKKGEVLTINTLNHYEIIIRRINFLIQDSINKEYSKKQHWLWTWFWKWFSF